MKTDKIFYTLFQVFQVFPELLFQLLGQPAELAQNYQFCSQEIKELAFRLDGIFLTQTRQQISDLVAQENRVSKSNKKRTKMKHAAVLNCAFSNSQREHYKTAESLYFLDLEDHKKLGC